MENLGEERAAYQKAFGLNTRESWQEYLDFLSDLESRLKGLKKLAKTLKSSAM